MSEIDVRRLCRRFGLVPPRSQHQRTDRAGKVRWTDCEWDLPDGGVLVLEVEGDFHLEVMEWGEDIKRARSITSRDRIVIRCTSFELRHEAEDVARDLIALGVPQIDPPRAA